MMMKNSPTIVYDIDLNSVYALAMLTPEEIERYNEAGLLNESHWEILELLKEIK